MMAVNYSSKANETKTLTVLQQLPMLKLSRDGKEDYGLWKVSNMAIRIQSYTKDICV